VTLSIEAVARTLLVAIGASAGILSERVAQSRRFADRAIISELRPQRLGIRPSRRSTLLAIRMEFLPQPNQPEHESPESNRRANEQPHRRGLELSIDPIACDASNQN
jgi:hypothetical protein